VFWIGLLAVSGFVRPAHRDRRFRRAGNIAVVVFVNYLPIAWPAALVVACTTPERDDQ
jgi:hypothetical protein